MNFRPGTEAAAAAGLSELLREPVLAPARTRVAVYHSRALARAGLVALLAENSFEVVAAAPLHSGPAPLGADVALIAGSGHGASNLAHRLGYESGTPVLMMLDRPPDGEMLLSVTASDANGCVCLECPPERVIRALRAVAAGGSFFECAHEPAEPPSPSPRCSPSASATSSTNSPTAPRPRRSPARSASAPTPCAPTCATSSANSTPAPPRRRSPRDQPAAGGPSEPKLACAASWFSSLTRSQSSSR